MIEKRGDDIKTFAEILEDQFMAERRRHMRELWLIVVLLILTIMTLAPAVACARFNYCLGG